MGDTGPCGPCSEIHVDIRHQSERDKIDGKSLVNADHPQVIEIWNLVFMQFNRKANRELERLPATHVDMNGLGCLAGIQGKQSNYDGNLFKPDSAFGKQSNKAYGKDEKPTLLCV